MFQYIFLDGRIAPVDEARLSVHANALSYGTGTFEGIRAFRTVHDGLSMLAPKAHFDRMHRSARILGLELAYSSEDLARACAQLLQRNEIRQDVYLRPLLILESDSLQVRMHGLRSRLSIAATPLGLDYINPAGITCMVSSWRRNADTAMPNRAKVVGGYVGPALAKSEAMACGFDEAIMLNLNGHVAEASTSNIFLRFGSIWVTPPPYEDILEGITRAELFVLIREVLGEDVTERSIDRSELYYADEVLLCGTAALVAPVVSIDGRPIGQGSPGTRTLELRRVLLAIARSEEAKFADWIMEI